MKRRNFLAAAAGLIASACGLPLFGRSPDKAVDKVKLAKCEVYADTAFWNRAKCRSVYSMPHASEYSERGNWHDIPFAKLLPGDHARLDGTENFVVLSVPHRVNDADGVFRGNYGCAFSDCWEPQIKQRVRLKNYPFCAIGGHTVGWVVGPMEHPKVLNEHYRPEMQLYRVKILPELSGANLPSGKMPPGSSVARAYLECYSYELEPADGSALHPG
jgi:hypothetical protein